MATSEGNFQRTARAYLEAINKYNGKTNAILTKLEELAMEQAARADEAEQRGEWLGLLHGVCITLKDCLHVAGYPNHVWFGALCRADFEVRFRCDCAVASGGSDFSREEQSHRVLLWRYR